MVYGRVSRPFRSPVSAMTVLNISLSSTLQSDLGYDGVWAYAFYWDASGQNHVELVTDGANNGTQAITFDDGYSSGKVYVVIQSEDPDGVHHDLGTLIAAEDDINWVNAETYDFRYDSIELTLSGSSTDVANLTSIAGFGLPMEIAVTYADNTTATRGYGVDGNTIFSSIGNIGNTETVATYSSGQLAGNNRAAISPSEDLGAPNTAFPASDWTDYVASLQSEAAAAEVELAGFFLGATDNNGVYHQPGFFSYGLEWDADDGAFWLSPDEQSAVQGYIRITPEALGESIYQTIGDVGIYTSRTDAEPYHILDQAPPGPGLSMQSGDNNQWGAVLAQLFNGFTAAYLGNDAKSINPHDTTHIDLDKTWNWDPTYAFGANAVGTPAHSGNRYAEIFFENSNSYGWTYSDLLMNQYAEGGPQISVANGNADVGKIDLTIFADDEAPSGYVPPVIHNYIPAGSSGYVPVSGPVSGNGFTLNFANAGVILDSSAEVSIGILTGMDGGPQFDKVTLDLTAGPSPWTEYRISQTTGGYTASPVSGVENPPGNIIVSGLPVGGDGTHWYQVNVGSGASLKTFNLYAEVTDGAFANAADKIAVDGLAKVGLPQSSAATIPAFTVNFLHDSVTGVDPSLLDRTDNPGATQPTVPIVGHLHDGSFVPVSGQDQTQENSVTTSNGAVVFGWAGLAGASNTPSLISGPTNKIAGLDHAAITITRDHKPVGHPFLAQADIDGQWHTAAPAKLGNGTYAVTMQAHTADNSSSGTAIDKVSWPTRLTVDVAEADLLASATGLGHALEGGEGVSGNWIALRASAAELPAGATLLLYAVDADGALLSRDGTQAGVGFSEAVRGTIGTVHADDGTLLLETSQSVYLEAGAELRIAVLSGGAGLDLDPALRIDERPDGTLSLEVAGVTLTAHSDNTLSEAAELAGTQRALDDALVYLTHGAEVDIRVVGSTAHINTLAFVRMDIDADGGMSVDGVEYGDTEAFRDAVREAIDNDFTLEAGGNFTREATWTVEGETGYYAPVLFAQTGKTFVIGDANPGSNEQIRLFGENVFGFEDLAESENSDFDYNDMVMTLSVADWGDDIII